MSKMTCPSCGEFIPVTGDAFCTYCHEPLDEPHDEVVDQAGFISAGNQTDSQSVPPTQVGGAYYVEEPIEFETCYQCESGKELSSTSVMTAPRSLASYFSVIARGVQIVTDRERIQIPTCVRCRKHIGLIRILHLMLFVTCIAIPMILAAWYGFDEVAEIVVIGLVAGPFAVLGSYLFFRDWMLGVQVYFHDGLFQYVVSKRFRSRFEEDFQRHAEKYEEKYNRWSAGRRLIR